MVLTVNLIIIAVAAIGALNDVAAFTLQRAPDGHRNFYRHRMGPEDDMPVILISSNKFISENSKQRPDADAEPFGAEAKARDEYPARRGRSKYEPEQSRSTYSTVTDNPIIPMPEDATKYPPEKVFYSNKRRYNPERNSNRWYARVSSEWV